MRKNWFNIGRNDFAAGRVSLLVTLVLAGEKAAANEYLRGRAAAKNGGVIPFYSKGPGENRIKRYENYRDS